MTSAGRNPFAVAADILDPPEPDEPAGPADGASAFELGRWLYPWLEDWAHTRLILSVFERIAAGEQVRALIKVPPQHGKTTAVRVGEAHVLRRQPNKRIMHLSYADDLAEESGREVRDAFRTKALGATPRRDTDSAKRWRFEGHRGGMRSVGMTSSVSGYPADVLVIDDPAKNLQAVIKSESRDTLWTAYSSVASTRLQPGASEVVLGTPWHIDDLLGRIESREGPDWEIIRLPVFAEAHDLLGRAVGEQLQRFDAEHIERVQRRLGPWLFSALYLLRPKAMAGGMFAEASLRHYTVGRDDLGRTTYSCTDLAGQRTRTWLADQCWRFQTVDLAGSVKTSADWTVVATWAVTPDDVLVLLDVARERLGTEGHFALVSRQHHAHKCLYTAVESRMLGHELVYAAGLAGLPLRELTASTDKVTRAVPASAKFAAGDIWLPAEADWVDTFVSELLAFFQPGEHDDQVDCLSYAALQIATFGPAGAETLADVMVMPYAGRDWR